MAVVAALVATTYRGLAPGVAVGLGALWSLANLALLERLVTALTGADRGSGPAVRRAAGAVLGMVPLFGAGGVLLLKLPPMWLAGGFLAPLAVLTLKAASTLVLGSRAWRAITASPWRAAALAAVVLVSAWWLVPARVHGQAGPVAPTATQAQAPQGAPAQNHAGVEHDRTESQGPEKFPNVITITARAFPHARWAHALHHNEVIVFSLLVAFLLCLVAWLASRNPQMQPGPLQNAVELLVEGLYNFITDIIGEKHAARFVPFLGTLGIYIWCMNLFGLVPFMDSPTSNLNVTFALALTVFVYVQYVGFRELGFVGYVDHMLGTPRDVTGWLLAPLMLPIHLLGELAKPISLSCRLFGNIFGEDMLLVAFVSLGITSLAFTHLPFGLPLQLPFLLLALLTSTLQAAVFMVLSTIYVLLMLPHDSHDEAAHAEGVQHAHPQTP